MVDLFPFDRVERGSAILLYGLGNCGRTYFEQNEQLGWCSIKYVSDRARPDNDFRDFYVKPEDIPKVRAEVDKIVVAIAHPVIARQVREQIIKNGIDKNMVISAALEKGMAFSASSGEAVTKRKKKILLTMGGGLGDYVVYLSFYQRLMDYLPDAEVVIQGRTALLDVVYGQKSNVKIISGASEIKDMDGFDCILGLTHYIKVFGYNPASLPETLWKKFEAYEAEYEGTYNQNEMRDALFIRRMVIAGRNRYDALGGGPIFNLGAVKLKIEYEKHAKDIYDAYHLKQYVTFNYGADKLKETTAEQMKVWPKEHYVEWIYRFKKSYPNVEVIQIGAKDATAIDGADRYILGEQFEVVKYILKNAMFHLDCEGGLVHLATAIGTKCIVLFGPTPLEYYAYPQNVNLCTKICKGCIALSDDWYYECVNNKKQCCMYSITPEMVMEEISNVVKWDTEPTKGQGTGKAEGKTAEEAMVVANYAAGVQVSKVGMGIVHPEEVCAAMQDGRKAERGKPQN